MLNPIDDNYLKPPNISITLFCTIALPGDNIAL